MKIRTAIIFGLGSIGRRHLRLLRERRGIRLLAFRSGTGRPAEGVEEVNSWDEVGSVLPQAAFITNPTCMHIDTAVRCARLGMHLFIEKPLDMRLKGAASLAGELRRRKLSSYVAYNLRFHPGIAALKEIVGREGFCHASARCSSYLPDWRPGTDHRKSYSSSAKMGGGVVLDLSHEADYCSYLFGRVGSIDGIARRSSAVTRDSEDVADMILRFEKGGHASVHVDFCSRLPERTLSVTTRKGTYKLDLISGRLRGVRDGRPVECSFVSGRDDTYRSQLDYFLGHIGRRMMNGVEEASLLLGKLLAFKKANGLI